MVALGALADIGDTVFILRELGRRDRAESRALPLLGSGIAGSVASVAVWREIASSSAP